METEELQTGLGQGCGEVQVPNFQHPTITHRKGKPEKRTVPTITLTDQRLDTDTSENTEGAAEFHSGDGNLSIGALHRSELYGREATA